MAERKLTVGTVNPGAYAVLPVYDSVIARNNSLPAPVAGEIMFITDRRQVKLYTNDGKWV
jgi:hypothetical protein